MRAPQQIESDEQQEVASLLIPLVNKMLLLPNVTVAEIVPVGQITPIANSPEWLLGELSWRELSVPLMALEVINASEPPPLNAHCRVAVLNTTGVNSELGFIALLTQGLPRLARVTPEEIVEHPDVTCASYDRMAVHCAGETAIIPDVEKLEKAYIDCIN